LPQAESGISLLDQPPDPANAEQADDRVEQSQSGACVHEPYRVDDRRRRHWSRTLTRRWVLLALRILRVLLTRLALRILRILRVLLTRLALRILRVLLTRLARLARLALRILLAPPRLRGLGVLRIVRHCGS